MCLPEQPSERMSATDLLAKAAPGLLGPNLRELVFTPGFPSPVFMATHLPSSLQIPHIMKDFLNPGPSWKVMAATTTLL